MHHHSHVLSAVNRSKDNAKTHQKKTKQRGNVNQQYTKTFRNPCHYFSIYRVYEFPILSQ